MKITPHVFGVVLTLIATSAFAQSGDELFEKVKAKYSSCASFSCEGGNVSTSDMRGKDKPFRSEMRFSTIYKRPDLLRVDWITPSMTSFTPVASSLYTDSGKYYGVSSFKRDPTEFKNLEMGMGAYAGISGGNTYLIPSLLMGKRGYITNATSVLLPDTQIDGQDCSVIEIDDKKTGTWTFSVDKATLGILRIQQIHRISAEQSKAMMEETKERMKGKNIELPEAPDHDYTIETFTNFKKIAFDQEMSAADFVFTEAAPLTGK